MSEITKEKVKTVNRKLAELADQVSDLEANIARGLGEVYLSCLQKGVKNPTQSDLIKEATENLNLPFLDKQRRNIIDRLS